MEKLAIEGGKPYKTSKFPKWPYGDNTEIESLKEVVLSNNWWRMTGTKILEFEKKFAAYHNVNHCLCVTNGTAAIECVLSAMDITRGDEVIIPGFTFISTLTAVIYNNATPIIVDIDEDTFCMSIEELQEAITPKTKVIIPVHMAGHCCDMEAISAIAKKYRIKIIEDAAHAHGGEWNNKKIGYYSDASIFSFQNGKIMTSGEGGAIITNDEQLYEKMFLIHGVGRPKNDRLYKHIHLGTNYRMTEFQAAVLLSQLKRLPELNKKRDKNAILLDEKLSTIPGITPQGKNVKATLNTHYMYMFYYDKNSFNGLSRNEFVEYLNHEGIPAYIAYPVISDVDFFKSREFRGQLELSESWKENELPISHKVANEVVWLPHFSLLGSEEDIDDIYGAILKIKQCMDD